MIIATRTLTLRMSNNSVAIPIRIFSPVFEKEGAWFCRYEIDWPDKKSNVDIGGFDPVQCLVHALQSIGAEIYSSSYHERGQVLWGTPGNGYGFPVVPSYRELLQGDDAKYL